MRKSSVSTKPVRGNSGKFESYKEAWARINQSQDNHFYLEAIALEESIISDRLASHLTHHGVMPDGRFVPLGRMLKAWRKLEPGPAVDAFSDLQADIKNWSHERNSAVHGLVKSDSGEAPMELQGFLEMAQQAAQKGAQLARALQKWHKAQISSSQ